MSIEIELENGMDKMSQCEGCFHLVRSVFSGEFVMVGPNTVTARKTGWGDSAFFGKISVAFDKAIPVVKGGIVHLIVPVIGEIEFVTDGEEEGTIYFDSLGHDLKPLP